MTVELVSGRDERLILTRGPEGLKATLKGTADAAFMTTTLEALHQDALARRHAAVILDLSQLAPLEPAAVKAVIKWAMRQAELEPAERYAIALTYSEGISWQKVSLAAIAHLCPYVRLAPIA
ncbi:hypothetical protein D3C86_243470 [compost metagenome]